MTEVIQVGIVGALGKMGRIVSAHLSKEPEFNVCALYDKQSGKLENLGDVTNNLEEFLASPATHIVDFSVGQAVFEQGPKILSARKRYLVGATGYPDGTLEALDASAKANNTSCLVVPNFSLGANLMIMFSNLASKYFNQVEIVEAHHRGKLDAPSGTALATAKAISEAFQNSEENLKGQEEQPTARGLNASGVNIHSIRLDGVLAEQCVIFGSEGETLSIYHRTISRECYLAGIKLALRNLASFVGLRVGLTSVMETEETR